MINLINKLIKKAKILSVDQTHILGVSANIIGALLTFIFIGTGINTNVGSLILLPFITLALLFISIAFFIIVKFGFTKDLIISIPMVSGLAILTLICVFAIHTILENGFLKCLC